MPAIVYLFVLGLLRLDPSKGGVSFNDRLEVFLVTACLVAPEAVKSSPPPASTQAAIQRTLATRAVVQSSPSDLASCRHLELIRK